MTTESMRILLVEDNPDYAELLQDTLHRIHWENFRFTGVERLSDAIALMAEQQFDVLLLDLSLPDSIGADTFYRARSAAPHMPIVILTNADDVTTGLDVIRHDAQDYLVKGHTDGHQVARAIRYAIERKQMEDRLKQLHAELETRICERTSELAEANERVQREITERILAEARELTAVMEERTRMAREIHDTIAQGLAGIIIHLEAAECYLEEDLATARLRIAQAQQLARESLSEARHSVWALRPQALEEGNLVTALAALVDRTACQTTAHIDFTQVGAPYPLPDEMEHDLLRLCQQALNNAIKHAHAQQIHTQLLYSPQQIELCVEDDGQGFDPSLDPNSGSFGLRIMRERVARMHGDLLITSHPGQGAHVTVLAPRPPERQGDDNDNNSH